jgi:hypothetical protein
VALFLTLAALVSVPAWGQEDDKPAAPGEKEYKKALRRAEEEYRVFFKKPETPLQFWAAINFELDLGKFDVAGLHLGKLVAKIVEADKAKEADKVDDQLYKIEEAEGLSTFLRLRNITRWFQNPELDQKARKDVGFLIDRVTLVLEKRLSNPIRIQKLVQQLFSKSPEERIYAIKQLRRAGERAAPYLVDALSAAARAPGSKQRYHELKETLSLLGPEIVPPMLEVLQSPADKDYQEVEVRLAVLDLVQQFREKRAIPYLWHLSASPKYPPMIRARARQALAAVLGVGLDKLPEPRVALTRLAEQYYHHQAKYDDVRHETPPPTGEPAYSYKVVIWPWNGTQLGRPSNNPPGRFPDLVPAALADHFFGLRYARQALDLDPAYQPAQIVFLSLTLDQGFSYYRDQFLSKAMTKQYHDLLATVDADLLMATLDRGLADRNVAVILPLVRALGERGEVRAARPGGAGNPGGLVRALYFPDARVQWEAAQAVIHLPGRPSPEVAARVVEILGRFLADEPPVRALAVGVPEKDRATVRKALQDAGFDPVLTTNRQDTFAVLHHSASINAILIHPAFPVRDLPFLLSNLRADGDSGQLPILLLSPVPYPETYRALAARYAGVYLVPDGITAVPTDLKVKINEYIQLSAAPRFVKDLPPSQQRRVLEDLIKLPGVKFSPNERKALASWSLDNLLQMAQGKVTGYNLRPVRRPILEATRSKDEGTAARAIDILAQLPEAEIQQHLAGIVLDQDPARAKLRLYAAAQLQRHIQKHTLLLPTKQIANLRVAYADPATPEPLRRQLALVMGQFPQSQQQTGVQLQKFRP